MDPGTGPKVLRLRLSCKKYKLKSWNYSIWHECLGVGGGSFLSHFQGTEIWNQEEISKNKAKETVKKDSLKKGHLVALALFSFLVGLFFVHGFSMTLVSYNIDLLSFKKILCYNHLQFSGSFIHNRWEVYKVFMRVHYKLTAALVLGILGSCYCVYQFLLVVITNWGDFSNFKV